MQILPATYAPDELAVVDHKLAAREHLPRVALHLEALEDGVVGVHALGRCRNRILRARIPDENIRVGTSSHYPLFGIHAEDAGRSLGRYMDKPLQRNAARVHAMVIRQLHAVLDSRAAVGD